MKVIIGLGNPGKEYKNTRHNAGFLFIDALAKKLGLDFKLNKKLKAKIAKDANWLLIKPQTFMNLSGQAVRAVLDYYLSPDDYLNLKPLSQLPTNNYLLLAHDDLDLPMGEYKLIFAKSPKEHNGVLSVEKYLGTDEFWRLRVGIDGRLPSWRKQTSGADYVLSSFSKDELEILNQLIQKVITQLQ